MSNLIICGFKGSGKTTFGKQLSSQLDLPFLDTDVLVEQRKGLPKRKIFLMDQGKTFHQLEKEVIASLKGTKHHIISLGGGTLCDPENVEMLLKLGQLLYLKVDRQTIASRIETDFFIDFEAEFKKRTQLYESLPVWVLHGQ